MKQNRHIDFLKQCPKCFKRNPNWIVPCGFNEKQESVMGICINGCKRTTKLKIKELRN